MVVPGVADVLHAGLPHVVDIGVVGRVGRLGRRRGLPPGNAEMLLHELGDALFKVLVPPQAHVGVEEFGLLEQGNVGGQQLRVVGHHRAVVVVVADALVVVVGHAGVPDGVHALLHQGLHMAVEQLCGVAHGVGRDGVLALEVELAGGLGGEHHLEVEAGKEPEGQVFIHVQPEGDAHAATDAGAVPRALEGAELLVLVGHQIGVLHLCLAQGAGTAVARDEAPPAVKGVDGEGAVVGAQVAGGGLGGVGEGL